MDYIVSLTVTCGREKVDQSYNTLLMIARGW
jgi:hypothetical protein